MKGVACCIHFLVFLDMYIFSLLRYGHISEVWELLKNVLPEWKLPLQEWEKALLEEEKQKKEETQSAVSVLCVITQNIWIFISLSYPKA